MLFFWWFHDSFPYLLVTAALFLLKFVTLEYQFDSDL
jgi:hypothetical protein